jgi:hypothetical protein
MKIPEDFWKEYDATLAEVRAERIVTERVTPLRHDTTAKARAAIAIQCLMTAIETLENLCEHSAGEFDREAHHQLDDADTRISLLRTRLKMRRSTIHLCSQFGKAP